MVRLRALVQLAVISWFAMLAGSLLAGRQRRRAIAFSRLVNLSHIIHEAIPRWPGDPPIEFQVIADRSTAGYFLRRFGMGEHSATHMNASSSFVEGGQSIDAYSPKSLIAPAVLIDILPKASANPDYALTVDDILAWEAKHGQIPQDSLALLFTGWQDRWSDPKAFLNLDSTGRPHFPGFSAEAARFLLDQRGIAGLGTDTHGLEPGWDSSFAVNTLIAERNAIALECLTQLDQLPPSGATLVIGVLRLQNGSGSPVAVLAFLP